MEIEASSTKEFEVNFKQNHIIKALTSSTQNHILNLSNLDLLSGRFPVTYFYFYPNSSPLKNFPSIIKSLSTSLSQNLNHYYPFAGRIVQNPTTNEPEIVCDNTGALLTEAYANIALKKLNFYDLDEFLHRKLVRVNPNFPFQVQVTSFTCGGVSLTFTFDHALGDASAFGKFLTSWSEIARKKPISCLPNHHRSMIHPRSPPNYHPSLDDTFMKCTMEEILNIPTPTDVLLKRLYYIDAARINELQSLASSNKRVTKIEAFSAYVWKTMVTAIDGRFKSCKMGWLVDGRGRLGCGGEKKISSNYIGNVLSVAVGEASVAELNGGSLSDIAVHVHDAISKATNEAHFLDLIDWIECHRPGLMLSRAVLGRGGGGAPALVLSSGRRFPVTELEFGFGCPVLGTVCSTIEKIGVGYMNQRQSGRGDGSWTVSAILWPELANALESGFVFQRMSAGHLQL